MGRHKTISNEAVLKIAQGVFRDHGHTVSTRVIADAAGISEGVLYQRFGSKDDLFFAAMRPVAPDPVELLGPEDPMEEAEEYLPAVVLRLGKYFAEVIPLGLHVMTHPSFDPSTLARALPRNAGLLQDGLVARLEALKRRHQIALTSTNAAGQLLVSLAHDWGLRCALARDTGTRRVRELKDMVEVIWRGLQER